MSNPPSRRHITASISAAGDACRRAAATGSYDVPVKLSQLIAVARRERPGGLRVWTFVSNVGAQRVCARHGPQLSPGCG
jgi:hypothetical protein